MIKYADRAVLTLFEKPTGSVCKLFTGKDAADYARSEMLKTLEKKQDKYRGGIVYANIDPTRESILRIVDWRTTDEHVHGWL